MGTRAQVTQPLPSRVSNPKPPRNMQGIGSRLVPAGPILQGPPHSTPEGRSPALALPARAHGFWQFPGSSARRDLPLPARGS